MNVIPTGVDGYTSWKNRQPLNSFEIDPSQGKLYAGRDVLRSSPLSFGPPLYRLCLSLLPRLRRSPIKRSRMEIQSSIYPASDPRNKKIISRSDRLACSGQLLFPNKFHLAEGKHVFELVLLEFDLLECSMMKLYVCVCVCVCVSV